MVQLLNKKKLIESNQLEKLLSQFNKYGKILTALQWSYLRSLQKHTFMTLSELSLKFCWKYGFEEEKKCGFLLSFYKLFLILT